MTKQETIELLIEMRNNCYKNTSTDPKRFRKGNAIDIAVECVEKQMSMARKLSDIEEVIYDYCDTMVYKIIMEKIAEILGVELIQIGLE